MQNNILRMPAVTKKTGLSRSTVYLLIEQGKFPKRIKLSSRAVGFLESDVNDWLESKRA